jgi:hypothetical protein
MSEVRILASPDFDEQTATVVPVLDSAFLGIRPKGRDEGEKIDLKEQLDSVSIQTEDEVHSLAGAAGWGLLGTLLLGTPGLLLGALWGGRKRKEVCFAATFKDGRKFLGLTDVPTYQRFSALAFR